MAILWISIKEIASARSGDKGNHANIGIIARSEQAFRFLSGLLTKEFLHEHFSQLGVSRTERFELPKVWALNFVLYDALAGGASQSLRTDTQGKLLGTEIMELKVPVADADLELLQTGGWRPKKKESTHGTIGQD